MDKTDNPVIRQFLAGRPEGPISMDEMAEDDRSEIGGTASGNGQFPAGNGGARTAPPKAAGDSSDSRYDDEDWETPPGKG